MATWNKHVAIGKPVGVGKGIGNGMKAAFLAEPAGAGHSRGHAVPRDRVVRRQHVRPHDRVRHRGAERRGRCRGLGGRGLRPGDQQLPLREHGPRLQPDPPEHPGRPLQREVHRPRGRVGRGRGVARDGGGLGEPEGPAQPGDDQPGGLRGGREGFPGHDAVHRAGSHQAGDEPRPVQHLHRRLPVRHRQGLLAARRQGCHHRGHGLHGDRGHQGGRPAREGGPRRGRAQREHPQAAGRGSDHRRG